MKLSQESLRDAAAWQGYHLPAYDREAMIRRTRERPVWLHFGAGNIFRAFPAVLAQRLLEAGESDTGVICCEGYDEEIISRCFHPYDDLAVAVTLRPDGDVLREVVGSVAESLTLSDAARVEEIFCAPSLQIVTFTITEKGYALRDGRGELLRAAAQDMESGPAACVSFMGRLTALCLKRYETCGAPLTLLSMDNCSENGGRLRDAVLTMARAWHEKGWVRNDALAYLAQRVAYPWSMIDKITPRPDGRVAARLKADGLEGMEPFVTAKHTYTAAFVNAEGPQYLVVEDCFLNGRPALEHAGVIFTDRESVGKVEKMKVSTCLNPLHTALAVFGCVLGYETIADEMKDPQLVRLITRMSREEGMPVVTDPGIIDPEAFLQEVLTVRFPNPFMPDTPQRIATDTSQKIAVRFGQTIAAHQARGTAGELKWIPLVLAGWLRYLLGVDDAGEPFALSPDPLLETLREGLSGVALGGEMDRKAVFALLGNTRMFGADLAACGLCERTAQYLQEMCAAPGAVRMTLEKYLG